MVGRTDGALPTALVFAGLLATFGTAFALTTPPCLVPDENEHLARAAMVSEGRLRPALADGWGWYQAPEWVRACRIVRDRLAGHAEVKWSADERAALWALQDGGPRAPVRFEFTAGYTFVPYLPTGTALAVGRLVGLPPATRFYAGRLVHVALTAALIGLAVWLAPVGRVLLGGVALLPMTAHQAGSFSPDATLIPAAFLAFALALRLALRPAGEAFPRWTLVGLALAVAWLGLGKLPYAALALLILAVPAAALGGWRRYTPAAASVLAVAFLSAAVASALTRPHIPDPHTLSGAETSIRGQAAFLKVHPAKFATAVTRTLVDDGTVVVESLAVLGWLDTPTHRGALWGWLCWLGLLAGVEATAAGFAWRARAAGLAALAASGGLILLSLYVWWTPVGHPVVVGLQGRYLIPLLPLLVFAFPTGLARLTGDPRLLSAATAAFGSVLCASAWARMFQRAYLTEPVRWLSDVWLLAPGVVLAATVVTTVWLMRRTRPADNIPAPTSLRRAA